MPCNTFYIFFNDLLILSNNYKAWVISKYIKDSTGLSTNNCVFLIAGIFAYLICLYICSHDLKMGVIILSQSYFFNWLWSVVIDVNFFMLPIVNIALLRCTTLSIFYGKPNNVGLSMSGNFDMKFVSYFWFFGMFKPNATYACPLITSKLKYFFKYARNTFWSDGLSILPP